MEIDECLYVPDDTEGWDDSLDVRCSTAPISTLPLSEPELHDLLIRQRVRP